VSQPGRRRRRGKKERKIREWENRKGRNGGMVVFLSHCVYEDL
jgi:hypothetical protein